LYNYVYNTLTVVNNATVMTYLSSSFIYLLYILSFIHFSMFIILSSTTNFPGSSYIFPSPVLIMSTKCFGSFLPENITENKMLAAVWLSLLSRISQLTTRKYIGHTNHINTCLQMFANVTVYIFKLNANSCLQ
jgi:hypothetical protein